MGADVGCENTVKLFHLPTTPTIHHAAYTSVAIQSVLAELNTPHIDLLIISFPSITFDAEDLPSSPSSPPDSEPTAEVAAWLSSYRVLESFHASGHIKRLGISEFGTNRLEELLPHTNVKPSVDQINVRDCCVVPKPLIVYAKEKGIELLTHNDCWELLAETELEGVLREELGEGWRGEGDAEGKRAVPLWVVKYTAVVRSRGVVENKGYVVLCVLFFWRRVTSRTWLT